MMYWGYEHFIRLGSQETYISMLFANNVLEKRRPIYSKLSFLMVPEKYGTKGFISSHAIVKYNWLAVLVGHFIGRTYFVTALLRVMEI